MRRFLILLVAPIYFGCATATEDLEVTGPMREAGKGETTLGLEDDTGALALDDTSVTPPGETGPSETGGVVDTGSVKESGTIFETDPACDAGLSVCGSACVDLARSEAHCGMCGKACAATEKCVAGACEIVCAAPTTKCGAVCVNTNNNEANCGMCGKACAAGETCMGGTCIPPIIKTDVAFPSTTSSTGGSAGAGTLGAGGGGKWYVTGDFVTQTFPRTASATKLTVNFRMSDWTNSYCSVGNLTWNVLVNGTVVGNYAWLGGTTPYFVSAPGPDQTVSKSYTFAAIAPAAGGFTIRLQATKTVCPGAGAWNWYPGGTASLE